jgi:hypothetical protein
LHFLETAAEAVATTSNHSEEDAAAADDDDDNNNDDNNNDDNDNDNDDKATDDTDKENKDIMPPKTITKAPKTLKTTAGAKSDAPPVVNVDSITSGIQGVTVIKGVKEKPAFTSYSTRRRYRIPS